MNCSIRLILRKGILISVSFMILYGGNITGTNCLRKLILLFADDSNKTIGLFNVDLFIPILTYIFGQAFLSGRSGIASTVPV